MLLAWARDRLGAKVHVGEIDPGARRVRAPFTCLSCGQDLVAHLGQVRAHHFAHHPGAACPLAHPESVLHLNAKERLLRLCQDGFARRYPVWLSVRCPACRRAAPIDLLDLGDAAVVEGAAPGVRADVLVTRAGVAAMALEVMVSHALGPAKEAALEALGLPAIEIDAREDWEREREAGYEVLAARALGLPRCAACELAGKAASEQLAGGERGEVAALEAYRARGLLGPPPGPPAASWEPLSAEERQRITSVFRCPACEGSELHQGERLLTHPCPIEGGRPVAWRGLDGALIALAWWRRNA